MTTIEYEVRKRLAILIQRKQMEEERQDFKRMMHHAATGILVRPRAPSASKWWNSKDAREAMWPPLQYQREMPRFRL